MMCVNKDKITPRISVDKIKVIEYFLEINELRDSWSDWNHLDLIFKTSIKQIEINESR